MASLTSDVQAVNELRESLEETEVISELSVNGGTVRFTVSREGAKPLDISFTVADPQLYPACQAVLACGSRIRGMPALNARFKQSCRVPHAIVQLGCLLEADLSWVDEAIGGEPQ